jgi:5-methylcytosine-specific restriction endonuclease McrA
MLECRKCQLSTEPLRPDGQCRQCYNNYMRAYMRKRYYARRDEAIERLGGLCVDCGTEANLQFDHQNLGDKARDVSSQTWSGADFWEEIAKCALRCERCHRKKTSREASVEHGQGATGKKNCRCELCGPLKNAYLRQWKENQRVVGEMAITLDSYS